MGIPNLSGSVFSVIVRTAEYLFNRKSQQRRAGEAASQLVSVLDRFVVDCDAVVTDDGYPPFTNPEYGVLRRNRRNFRHEPGRNAPDHTQQ